MEGLLAAAMAAAGPAGAFSALAFARAAGYGPLAAAARAAAAADVAGGLLADSAGLASLNLADLRSVLLVPSAAAASPTASPPRPAVPARTAFDAVAVWYEADPDGRACHAAGLLEACVRLRRLRPAELEALAEAPLTNATPEATAEFARAYLDVGYMGVWEFEVEPAARPGAAAAPAPGPSPARLAPRGRPPAGGAVLMGAVLRGVLAGGGVTPPRRRQRVGEGGGGGGGAGRPGSGGAVRRPLMF